MRQNLFTIIAAVLLILGMGVSASATMLYYNLDHEFSGGQAPLGSTPWIRAVFDDAAPGLSAGEVRLTMSTTNLVGSEFVEQWLFNFTGNSLNLTFAPVSESDAPATPSVNDPGTAMDDSSFKADGDGIFDFRFSFSTANSSDRFTSGEQVVYDIGYSSAIDIFDFRLDSEMGGGNGAYGSAAHVQSISVVCDETNPSYPDCPTSGWIGETEGDGGGPGSIVPEPSSMWLLGTAVIGLLAVRRRTR